MHFIKILRNPIPLFTKSLLSDKTTLKVLNKQQASVSSKVCWYSYFVAAINCTLIVILHAAVWWTIVAYENVHGTLKVH